MSPPGGWLPDVYSARCDFPSTEQGLSPTAVGCPQDTNATVAALRMSGQACHCCGLLPLQMGGAVLLARGN